MLKTCGPPVGKLIVAADMTSSIALSKLPSKAIKVLALPLSQKYS